ncbi:Beta-glucuronidase [Pseudocercospora fuligena]|uniref:Beta-glucuronidase n=1 Tax=Pseudocercospora fuligena TaxID=685502 RepID=A0A8H6VJH6_9PEZI|nr:Beta-glucuronidase [Pseudocercospora fuligena]
MAIHCKTSVLLVLAASCVTATPVLLSSRETANVPVECSSPADAGKLLDGFVSFSIEFSSFPDFAGNSAAPNTFSDNLLSNLRDLQGTKPYVRVGGNTQDFAIFNASQKVASIGIVNPDISPDYPSTLTIGPAYFESYKTWSDVKYSHGFNLGKNSSAARKALVESAPFACKTFQDNDRLLSWELGNEPDLYPGKIRPVNWTESQYVAEWLKYTREIRAAMEKACPELSQDARYKYIAPSFAGTGSNKLDPLREWNAGLDTDNDISLISSHNYISGANVPGVTLQGTLMSHTSNVASVAKHVNSSNLIHELHPELPYILGETNSLYNQGRPGLSNTFGAALWGIDFNLYCAANNISRVHMHMGTNYRYQSWQPIDTDLVSKGTKAPYYGNIGVAAFLGRSEETRVVNLPLSSEREAAYAAYIAGSLDKIMVINMMAYNATDYNQEYINDFPRPSEEYGFQLSEEYNGKEMGVQRLMANGSDAISGITFDGYSYNFELDEGRPVLLSNVTRGEKVDVDDDGMVKVEAPWSSAVILRF